MKGMTTRITLVFHILGQTPLSWQSYDKNIQISAVMYTASYRGVEIERKVTDNMTWDVDVQLSVYAALTAQRERI